jgi:hypothetical protein
MRDSRTKAGAEEGRFTGGAVLCDCNSVNGPTFSGTPKEHSVLGHRKGGMERSGRWKSRTWSAAGIRLVS